MTVEEIEIIVTAKVEEALKEFKKIEPVITKVVKQAQENFEKLDTKAITNKVHQAVQFVKKKIQDFKKSNANNEITIKVNNKEASKQISQIQKEIDSLQKKISERELKLNITNGALDKMREDARQEVLKEAPDIGAKGLKQRAEYKMLTNPNSAQMIKESDKLNNEIIKYNSLLDSAKEQMAQLGGEISQTVTTQNELSSFFSTFKQKIGQIVPNIVNIRNRFKELPKITQSITNNVKGMSNNIKGGLKHILKYAGALLSIRGVYGLLRGTAQSWLSSQNAGAQQLSANIEYLKYSMGSVFANILQYITNLIYNLMKAIQSLVYAFSGVNIFAKATASSMKNASKSAKDTNKSLAGVHNEINNVSEKNNSGGSGSTSPSMDLSQMDTQMSPLAEKLYDFFKPLVDSWNTYGGGLIEQIKMTAGQVGELISSIWGSFENIITNGTIYSILENILGIIGNIAEAFSNAWNYNGNGDAIIQNLADAFNNVLTIINNIVKSTVFQWLIDIGIGAIKLVTDAIKGLTDNIVWVSEKIGEFIGFFTGENSEKLDGWSIIIGSIATAIGLAVAAVTAWNVISAMATVATTAFGIAVNFLTSPITLVILAIAALIAIIVAIVVYWDEISAALSAGWEWIKQKAEEIFNAIADFLENLWQGICDTVTNIWNGIKDFLSGLWEGIKDRITKVWNVIKNFFILYFSTVKNIFETVWNGISTFVSNIFNGIKNTISNVLNTIKTIWNNIWNGLKNVVTNIFNGIWNTIKKVINSILGGIEGMANGIVNGVNTVIKALNKLKFDIPDWVPGLGGKTFGFNIGLISQVSLPRLAKGNVAYSPLIAQFGEYSGASTNPEITAPQNILKETFDDVLSDHEWNNNDSNKPIQIAVYVGNKKLGEIMLDDLRDKKRQTGKDLEALVGG